MVDSIWQVCLLVPLNQPNVEAYGIAIGAPRAQPDLVKYTSYLQTAFDECRFW